MRMTNIYEHSTEIALEPARLFAELTDVESLTAHMPRSASLGEPVEGAWLRVEEPDCTLSWGSAQHHPGSLDVLPVGPGRSRLVVRVRADSDVTAQLLIAVEALRTRFEDAAAA
ncbi:hypothetical protein HJ590_14405 [Naumannella sp. ID2617S]|nr:hypothetical protein [Naumannella sp. ID2617S]